MKSSPRASIIIRCFNEERHIGNLLESISHQSVQDVEIIVVDSGSTDNTLEIARRFPTRIVQIHPSEFTFGYSLNRGCEIASGAYFVFASAHVVPVERTWLEELLSPFEDVQVAATYGRQIGNTLTKFSEHQVFAKQFPPNSNPCQKNPFCNNANASIRADLWRVRKYDETLSGLEDLDWAKSMVEQGYYLAYRAEAVVIHIHDVSARGIFNRYKREAIALKRILPDSHLTLTKFIMLWLSNLGLDVVRAFRHDHFLKNIKDIMVFRTMQYIGTYLGLRYRSRLTHEMIMKFYYPRSMTRFRATSRAKDSGLL